MTAARALSWSGIFRLGLVQLALGAVVVLMTSTLNRVMTVELALPAIVPGALVGFHFLVQAVRPWMGHGSDRSGRRGPWIIGGMVVLATGGVAAAAATAWVATNRAAGLTAAVLAYALIGAGVSAVGTPLLAMVAERVAPARRAAAAAITWLMMIVGFILTTAIGGNALDPFSMRRLVEVSMWVGGIAVLLTVVALWGMERDASGQAPVAVASPDGDFRRALATIWRDPAARRFSCFVFVAMLAFSAQDLILEPFAGLVFGLTPGGSTRISSMQNGGMLAGMLTAALVAHRFGTLRQWAVAGCVASAVAFAALAMVPSVGSLWVFKSVVFGLGASNGVFAVGAIGSMMGVITEAGDARTGARMGVFGAAQGLAYGIGGFAGAWMSDLARGWFGSPSSGYASVFAVEAMLFALSGWLAATSAPAVRGETLRSRHGSGDALLGALR